MAYYSFHTLMEKTAAFGMPAIAITDLGNLYATVKFYQDAFKAGIKPIIGVDMWIINDKNPNEPSRLTLLCQNNEGYKNLLNLFRKVIWKARKVASPLLKKLACRLMRRLNCPLRRTGR